jgi:hypothetical protein
MGWNRVFKTKVRLFNEELLEPMPPDQYKYLLEDGFMVFIRAGMTSGRIGFIWTESARESTYAVCEIVPIVAKNSDFKAMEDEQRDP